MYSEAEAKLIAAIKEAIGLFSMYPPGSRLYDLEPLLWRIMQKRGDAMREALVEFERERAGEDTAGP
jgi:hypothetical protein